MELWPEVMDVSHEETVNLLDNVRNTFYNLGNPANPFDRV